MSEVRVRFAPSPTGELHVGGLRTALFNYLFAKAQGGKFILRIEDTDQERYVEGAEQGIISMLQWAGLTPDEGPGLGGECGPYRQSERLTLYREAAEKLIADGHAYRCYTTPEELDEMRAQQQAKGLPPKYDGRHRNLSEDERRHFEAQGRTHVVRMRIPDNEERIVVDDMVRGKVAFNSSQLDDQVILKSDGFPTYHLAVVVDDNAMGVTHILRAEEWLPSTPKHLYLYKWLGLPVPQYGHLPLLLNDDRSKMSKRSGDTAAEDYRAKGYLADALVNFLALLGWNPGDEQEIFTRAELQEKFDLARINKSGAVFDRKKLDWMNQIYIGKLSEADYLAALQPYLEASPFAGEAQETLHKICLTLQPQLVTLAEIGAHLPLFFKAEDAPLKPDVQAALDDPEARPVFEAFHTHLAEMTELNQQNFKEVVKQVGKETNAKGKGLWGALRMAITLDNEGPDLGTMAEILGRDKVLSRVGRTIGK